MASEQEPPTASAPRGAEADGERDRPVGDVFSQFGQELTEAMRAELRDVSAELAGRVRGAAKGTGLLAAAGVAGAVAGAAVLSVPLILTRRVLPPGATAMLVAAGAGAVAAYLTKRGLEELGDVMPVETEQLKEAAKGAVQRAATEVMPAGSA